MTLKEHYKRNITLAYPVMLSQVGHVLVSVSDSIMVGRLGATPLASVSLANSFFTVIMLFGIGMSYGMTPWIAASDGANDSRGVAMVLKNGLWLYGVLGVLLLLVGLAVGQAMHWMQQDSAVLQGALPYYYTLVSSLLPLMIFQTFRQFIEGLSMTKQVMYLSVLGNLMNVFLNYGLIYGKMGLPALGLLGAGWSSLVARVLMAVGIVVFVLSHAKLRLYMLTKHVPLHMSTLRRILRVGVPTGLQYVFEISAFSVAAVMIGWQGAKALAAHQIAINLSAITYMMATGLAAVATIRTGNQWGKKDFSALRTAGMTCFVMAAAMMTLCGAGLFFGHTWLPTWYTSDPTVVRSASTLLLVAAFFQVSDGVQAVGLGALRGISEVKTPTYITLMAYWMVAIPLGYLFGICFDGGAVGVWVGLFIGLTWAAVAHLARFHMLTKRMLR